MRALDQPYPSFSLVLTSAFDYSDVQLPTYLADSDSSAHILSAPWTSSQYGSRREDFQDLVVCYVSRAALMSALTRGTQLTVHRRRLEFIDVPTCHWVSLAGRE
jgi:hypothetical protein